ELQPRHEHAAAAVCRDRHRDRALGRDEGEAGVVEDVVAVEEDGAGEAALPEPLRERVCPLLELFPANRERHAARSLSRQAGSDSRRRRTRSATGGWVTNSAARPSSANG